MHHGDYTKKVPTNSDSFFLLDSNGQPHKFDFSVITRALLIEFNNTVTEIGETLEKKDVEDFQMIIDSPECISLDEDINEARKLKEKILNQIKNRVQKK